MKGIQLELVDNHLELLPIHLVADHMVTDEVDILVILRRELEGKHLVVEDILLEQEDNQLAEEDMRLHKVLACLERA